MTQKHPRILIQGCIFLAYAIGDDHKTTVFQRIFAGGQTDQLIAAGGCVSRFVEGKLLASGNEFVKFLLPEGIFKLVIAEALAYGSGGLKNGEDLISMILIQSIENNDFSFLQINLYNHLLNNNNYFL